MGWLWTSSPPKPPTDQPSPSPSPSPTSALPPASSSSIPNSSQAPNEPVDPEIQKLLDLFNKSDDTPKSSSSTSSNQPPSALTSWLSSKFSSAPEALPVPPLDPVSESLLPTEMSCRQAFDQAWSCNSLGGQWNAVYRHGEMRSCSHLWDDFWFCMRTKSFSGTIKENAVREHYRRKEYEKYYAPGTHSSEEIWEAREHKVAPGTAFSEAIEIAQVDDDEWRRLEDERRRKIRQDLGYEKKS